MGVLLFALKYDRAEAEKEKAMNTSRFVCPSASLGLKLLLNRTRRVLWLCLVGALVIHFGASRIRELGAKQQAAKPLTIQFIKRAPRLTKPLEMKKRPQPKRRTMQRQMVSVKARIDRQRASSGAQTAQVMRSLAKPRVDITGSIALPATGLEPEALAQQIQGAKEPEQKVDMSLEMLSIESLDTGQYQAMVVQDPNDKRKVKGFFHLAGVYSPSIESGVTVRICLPQFKITVAEAMNRFTDIKTDAAGTYTLDSRELFNTPWIFINAGDPFELTDSEAQNLGQYLLSGGFAFAETWAARPGGPGDRALRNMFKDALYTQGLRFGKDWSFQVLPNDHPIFHCYFDFDGPPAGFCASGFSADAHLGPLDGIAIEGRLIAIMSTMDIEGVWNWWWQISPDYDNTRALQFLVNMIVFALTQEGSIAQQLMEGMRNW